jgi:hypothetical protein
VWRLIVGRHARRHMRDVRFQRINAARTGSMVNGQNTSNIAGGVRFGMSRTVGS